MDQDEAGDQDQNQELEKDANPVGYLSKYYMPRRISKVRCKECFPRNAECSIRTTGHPCDRCTKWRVPCEANEFAPGGRRRGCKSVHVDRNAANAARRRKTQDQRDQRLAEQRRIAQMERSISRHRWVAFSGLVILCVIGTECFRNGLIG
jgi:hypothetical protein